MPEKSLEVLVEGGSASAGPPLGPTLAPMGVNIKEVVDAINEKTKEFKGMKVPVNVTINTDTKEFRIEVGSPPVSQLIKKELKLEKLAQKPGEEKIADMKIEQVIKIAKMKEDSLAASNMTNAVKTIIGSCVSLGVLVEGKDPRETINDIGKGKFKEEIAQEKTELTAEELKEVEEDKKKLAEEMERRKAELEETAKKIVGEMKGHEREEIVAKLKENSIPKDLIDELLPKEAVTGKVEEKKEEDKEEKVEEDKEESPKEEKKEEKK
jgi:large subunit ribosomal protein L11